MVEKGIGKRAPNPLYGTRLKPHIGRSHRTSKREGEGEGDVCHVQQSTHCGPVCRVAVKVLLSANQVQAQAVTLCTVKGDDGEAEGGGR